MPKKTDGKKLTESPHPPQNAAAVLEVYFLLVNLILSLLRSGITPCLTTMSSDIQNEKYFQS